MIIKGFTMKNFALKLSLLMLFLVFELNANQFELVDKFVLENKRVTTLNSGTAVVIVKGDEIVYEGYFGYADVENKVPVDKDTVFYIASMTKPIFSLLTLIKESKGELDTNWDLNKILPDVAFKRSIQSSKVTIEDLLSHKSGIDNWPLIQVTAYTGQHDQATLKHLIEQSYVNENAPLGDFKYTNVGYNILSYWMDENNKETWQDLLKNEVFSPLGMKHTSARISDADKYGWSLAKGYSINSPDKDKALYLKKIDNSMHSAGGVISTATDLGNFILAQINEGKLNDRQLLPRSVVAKFKEPLTQPKSVSGGQQYGWGWYIRERDGNKLLAHRGGYSGTSTYMSFMPEKQVGLIVLSNQDRWGGNLAYGLEAIVYSIALGKPESEVQKTIQQYEKFTESVMTRFKENNTPLEMHIAKDLPNNYIGTYHHSTLGEIALKQLESGEYFLSWGNLKSKLFATPNSQERLVEFIPNKKEKILFYSNNEQQHFIQYKDYMFEQQ